MNDNILTAKNISKSYGRLKVLTNINLNITKGDRYILYGSNGAGKTTLVKILSTLLYADSGELSLFGEIIRRHSTKQIKALIGFMSHQSYLYNDLSAMENLNFYANLYSIKNKKERIENLLKEIGLYHRSHDRIGNFSRGMKQRLALARALLHDPDLIFLDEPYAGLDIRAQEILNDIIIQLNKRGKTFFFITHDISKGFEVATRSGILSNGQIVYETKREKIDTFSKKYKDILLREQN
jgi:ABC-type multidrug transport system ATPase subunit